MRSGKNVARSASEQLARSEGVNELEARDNSPGTGGVARRAGVVVKSKSLRRVFRFDYHPGAHQEMGHPPVPGGEFSRASNSFTPLQSAHNPEWAELRNEKSQSGRRDEL